MKACRENFYFKKLAILLACFNLYGLAVYLWLDPFFSIMPILSADSCFYIIAGRMEEGGHLSEIQLHMNQLVFLILNWVELFYLYWTWRKLKKQFNQQLDIKREMLCAVFSWIGMSACYLLVALYKAKLFSIKHAPFLIRTELPLIGILLRNLGTFWAQTLFTIAQLRKDKEDENYQYHTNDNLVSNLSLMNLDVVMTHKITFTYFNDYVEQMVKDHIVYLNFYKSVRVYKKKISQLLNRAEQIEEKNGGDAVNFKYHEDRQLGILQQTLGRLIMTIMDHLKENQKDFPGIRITDFHQSEMSTLNTPGGGEQKDPMNVSANSVLQHQKDIDKIFVTFELSVMEDYKQLFTP